MPLSELPADDGQTSQGELKSSPENNHELLSIEELLREMEAAGIKPLDAAMIRDQLETVSTAILTRDFLSGLRASVEGRKRDKIAKIWTTNGLDDHSHPLSQQFRFRKFSFE